MPRKTIYSDRQRKLAALLRELRLKRGMRQIDLGEAIGRPQSFVAKVESGERRVDLIELEDLCAALGVSLQTVVRRYQAK